MPASFGAYRRLVTHLYIYQARWRPELPMARIADRSTLKADGQDLSFITVTVSDKTGLFVPRAKNRLRFEISGPAEIVAVDSGDATSHESFQAKERNAYNGLCLVIVRTKAGKAGQFKLKAKSEGLNDAEISITSAPIR